jgi:NADPH2:quinone reductase
MQAIRIHEYGDADVCRLESVEVPRPGVGEVLIKVEVAGLNFIDVHLRLGRYAKSDTYRNALPMTLGMEGAGTVAAVGADVDGLAVGDRVAWCIVRGSFAQYALLPAAKLVVVPDALDLARCADAAG